MKSKIKILIALSILFVFSIPACERDEKQTKRVAKIVFESRIKNLEIDSFRNINSYFGPFKISTDSISDVYMWYRLFDYGDTGIINITVEKNRLKDYRASVSYNDAWQFLTPFGNFSEIFPDNYINHFNNSISDTLLISFYEDKNHSIHITKEKVLHYLKNGYFKLYLKTEDSTIIEFNTNVGLVLYDDKLVETNGAVINYPDSLFKLKPIIIPDSILDM